MLGHPPGLFVLFFTELWERFSYYGMRALLILYMTNHFRWVQEDASRVYKWYTALVYLTPLLGGYMADRWLGNRRAVIIGGALMAIGHFLMAFEAYPIFFSALIFLILGNGFFKPNMSVQVGRLYVPGDPRRDAAYTIFYMGINLGALLSPLVCGTLGEKVGFHWGFSAAGVGMVIGLLIYLLGQRWVVEVDTGGAALPVVEIGAERQREAGEENGRPAYRWLHAVGPWGFVLLALAALVAGPVLYWTDRMDLDNAIFCVLVAGAVGTLAAVLFRTRGRERDRTMAICLLLTFVVAFWMAFEQAGNVLNVWADKHTDRYVFAGGEVPAPAVELPAATQPAPAPAGRLAGWEMPASWFQSVNPTLIVVLAPAFAWLWVWLARRRWEPSTPAKMAIGLFLAGMAFCPLVFAALLENRPSETYLARVPDTLALNAGALAHVEEDGHVQPYVAGRLKWDSETGRLRMRGVLSDLERDRILADSAPEYFREAVLELGRKSREADRLEDQPVSVVLPEVPPGFDLRWSTLTGVTFDLQTLELKTARPLAPREEKLLMLAGADPDLRKALYEIYRESSRYKVSPAWLLLHYLLVTMGELCLSPIGLSMVSKLAPARFATLLMGLWLCANFFANFLAGFLGEMWGTIAPVPFFAFFVVVCTALSLLLGVLVWAIRRLMHGVH